MAIDAPHDDAPTAGRAPGLTLTAQQPVDGPTVTVDGQPPHEVWQAIATSTPVERALVQSVRTLLAADGPTHHSQRAAVLRAHGVTAADGAYADVAIGFDRAPDSQAYQAARDVTLAFGSPGLSPLGLALPLAAIAGGPGALLGAARATPAVSVRLTDAFREQKATQRRAICALFATLADVVDLRIVATGRLQRWLADVHRADLPGVSDALDSRCPDTATEQLVQTARDTLAPDGRPVHILRTLAAEHSDTLSYAALYADAPVSNSRIRQCVGTLVDLDLVTTFERPAGRFVELLTPAHALLDALDTAHGVQAALDTFDTEPPPEAGRPGQPQAAGAVPTGTEGERGGQQSPADCVSDVGKSASNAVWSRAQARADRQGHPDEAAADATAQERYRLPSLHSVSYLPRWEAAAALSCAPEGGVGVVDHPISPRDDRAEGGWSFDADADRLVVSAEYDNPLQYWVTTAAALTNGRTFAQVLTADRLAAAGDQLRTCIEQDKTLAWDGRQLGYLPGEVPTVAAYWEQLQDARDDLLALTKDLHDGAVEDVRQFRGEITRCALGLACTMLHVLDVVGVDVVQEVRLPEYARSFDADRRDTLLTSVATGIAIRSRYGEHVAYRQLFESRPDKREAALPVTVDAADPVGALAGSVVIVGEFNSKYAEFVAALRDRLRSPAELQADAPEFAVPVPVRQAMGRPEYAQVVRRLCQAKQIEPTREGTALCYALARSPYDVATALAHLSRESASRSLRLDEARFALSMLAADRLLPDASPTPRAVVAALLDATAPLSRTELADRAGVSTRSLRDHLPTLQAADLVWDVAGGLRLALPFRTDDERYGDARQQPVALGTGPDSYGHLLATAAQQLVEPGFDPPDIDWAAWHVEPAQLPAANLPAWGGHLLPALWGVETPRRDGRDYLAAYRETGSDGAVVSSPATTVAFGATPMQMAVTAASATGSGPG